MSVSLGRDMRTPDYMPERVCVFLCPPQIRKLEDTIASLKAELLKPRDDAPSRLMVGKLHAAAKLKDEKLRQLRDAIKTLEMRLIDALKKDADE